MAGLALAAPAAARGSIICDGEAITIDIASADLPVLQVLGARITFGDRAWSTGPERGDGTPIVVGQAYGHDEILIDFTDPTFEKILLVVRLEYGDGDDWPLRGEVVIDGIPRKVDCGYD